MSDEKPKRTDVGFGRPPAEHRFGKGRSGNPKGRPRKRERIFEDRQIWRDIISVTEEPVTYSSNGKTTTVPTIVALLHVLRKKAAMGHLPSLKYFIELHRFAITQHSDPDNVKMGPANELRRLMAAMSRLEDEHEIYRKVARLPRIKYRRE